MARKSPLDDPENAAFAWARFRRLMRFMMGITLGVVIIAMAIIYKQAEEVSAHFFIATALGLGFSMLLMSALMGLVFLSAGTGHDASVDNSLDDLDPKKPVHDRRRIGWRDQSGED
ncbi:hypothetical protein [Aurantiacibacter gangjinensis]|uniref:Uncharacterized protein n=1 Tax=Aurantiacibacter gangjinensis TaxID=502682 RepID=A0A0G9MLD9_9SPHN|nr:hypothetical protein [Aurantiacibacter gangjinensis]APE27499.1 hypothetical protein BMF35_a0670 [Aurantiacibacter gangjinensis]KLE31556.1 hypothetical protein AAW01_08325 [Aurantiacibacter gangjinensis]